MASPVKVRKEEGGVTVIQMDDGKMNAFSFEMLKDLTAALETAEKERSAVVLLGNAKAFSAGFDLSVMQGKDNVPQRQDLLKKGVEMLLKVLMFPQPLVLGCEGHALALGAILLHAADRRIGAATMANGKPPQMGMNEVAIGMTLPSFGVELARVRLEPKAFREAVTQAKVYGAEEALQVGLLDEVVADAKAIAPRAIAEAQRLQKYIGKGNAFFRTKELAMGPIAEMIRNNLDSDLKAMVPKSKL